MSVTYFFQPLRSVGYTVSHCFPIKSHQMNQPFSESWHSISRTYIPVERGCQGHLTTATATGYDGDSCA